MAEPDAASLLKLMTWLSPSFPVGAFAYSHGLEAAVADGAVTDGEAAFEWIAMLLRHGSGWNDLVLLAEAHHAAGAGDDVRLADVAHLAWALAGSRERRIETMDLGNAFAEASRPWRCEAGERDAARAYPVAVGTLAARHGVPLESALAAYAHAFAANLVGACVRLVPLGQRDATAILCRLELVFTECAERGARSTLDDLGSAAILSDIAPMRHETLATRLFRS